MVEAPRTRPPVGAAEDRLVAVVASDAIEVGCGEVERVVPFDLDVLVEPSADNAARVVRALENFGAPLDSHGVTREDFEHDEAVPFTNNAAEADEWYEQVLGKLATGVSLDAEEVRFREEARRLFGR